MDVDVLCSSECFGVLEMKMIGTCVLHCMRLCSVSRMASFHQAYVTARKCTTIYSIWNKNILSSGQSKLCNKCFHWTYFVSHYLAEKFGVQISEQSVPLCLSWYKLITDIRQICVYIYIETCIVCYMYYMCVYVYTQIYIHLCIYIYAHNIHMSNCLFHNQHNLFLI